MKQLIKFVAGLIILISSLQVIADEVNEKQHLIAISMMLASGKTVTGTRELAITMRPQKGWHGYWLNPGDAGFPTRFNWQLPKGVTIGEVQYPAPSRLVTRDIMNYIYHGEYTLLAPVTVDNSIAVGTSLPITLDIGYLVCDPTSCLPEQQIITQHFTLGDAKVGLDEQQQFSQWRQMLPRPLAVNGRFAIEDKVFRLALPLPASVDSSDAHIYPIVNNTLVNNAKQTLTHEGDVLSMQTQAGDASVALFQGVLVLSDGTALSFDAHKTDASAFAAPSIKEQHSGSQGSWSPSVTVVGITAFFGAVLGGLLLNVMPCVFPILSLKILSLSHSGSEKDARMGSVAYTLGAVLVSVCLGGVILGLRAWGHQVGWAFQLQSPAVIAGLILLMSAIGFNLAGLFEIGTLTSGSRLQDQKGPMGDFWTGVLAAFIATPCTGPFMATALGAALVLPTAVAFMIFAGLGFGMALPFLLVGYIPALRTCLPKPGAWMVTARRILALPMFITALGLVWILMRQSNDAYVLSVLAATMLSTFGLWLTGLWQHSQHKGKWWPGLLLTLLPLLALIYWVPQANTAPQHGPEDASEVTVFNKEQLKLLAAQQDVFVYFTADWCLTCKVNEQTSIARQEVKAAFKQHNVATLIGDWTRGDSRITEFLAQHQRSGVPLYLWYKKGTDEPIVLPQILSPSILIDLAES
ncbi:protein-disulfide reductase DsbD family protein [Shewanella salipaludis]|uniref:Thiol:disulfide interchange protein n=1 Tax=Shewanella salipaludis TaxID=2723052 RepID=A0A972FWB8_9GAMM|nr:protein-disulfide reductase DsbD domain-containing protein [Shewanella salipaludis]NMH63827.1 thiol:disulfide interchange protein [Shewanella salipaludis]